MRNKLAVFTALAVICASAFFVPMTAYALPDETEPPAATDAVHADEAADADGAVAGGGTETVGDADIPDADERDVNSMGDFMTLLEALGNAGMAGFEPGGPTAQESGRPFTPDGQATVVDWAIEGNGKEFYTFKTPAGNVFFLVVDHSKASDNVYFLNAVTELDLMSLAGKPDETFSGNGGAMAAAAHKPPDGADGATGDGEPATSGGETPINENGDSNNSMLMFLAIAVLVFGGAGYYIKIVRPKKQAPVGYDDDEDDEPEGEDKYDEDIPFEDEAEYPEADSDDGGNGEDADREDE